MGKFSVDFDRRNCFQCGKEIPYEVTAKVHHGFCSNKCQTRVEALSYSKIRRVKTLQEFAQLHKNFIDGEEYAHIYHVGPLYSETEPYTKELKIMFENGFLTDCSQPGHTEANRWSTHEFGLSYISGVCTDKAVEKLKRCGLDYMLLVGEKEIYDCEDGSLMLQSVKPIFINVLGRDETSSVKDAWQKEIRILNQFNRHPFELMDQCPIIKDELSTTYSNLVVVFSRNYGYHTIFRDVAMALINN